ncbi:hypothetical protein L9F63_014894, partial [Diploptera punctata]
GEFLPLPLAQRKRQGRKLSGWAAVVDNVPSSMGMTCCTSQMSKLVRSLVPQLKPRQRASTQSIQIAPCIFING